MRIIYNTSYIVNDNSEELWLEFMNNEFISHIKQNDKCKDIIFTKVSIDQDGGKTYSLQLVFENETDMNSFLTDTLSNAEDILIQHYTNHYLCFSSILTEIG